MRVEVDHRAEDEPQDARAGGAGVAAACPRDVHVRVLARELAAARAQLGAALLELLGAAGGALAQLRHAASQVRDAGLDLGRARLGAVGAVPHVGIYSAVCDRFRLRSDTFGRTMWNVNLDGPSRRIIAEPAAASAPPEPAPVAPRLEPLRRPPRSSAPGPRPRRDGRPSGRPQRGVRPADLDRRRRARERAARRAAPRRPVADGRRVAGRHVREGHAAPAGECQCGVHAWHPRRRWARRCLATRGEIPGIVEARGTIELHHDGLRAQRARPYALVRARGSNPALLDRLAAAYGLPIVDARGPDDLVEWCRERGLGLSEEVDHLAARTARARTPATGAGRAPARGRGRRRRRPAPARDRQRSEGRAGPVRPDGADPRRALTRGRTPCAGL